MSRPWKRWIALFAFVVVMATTFVRLGQWQLHRLDWRRGVNARVETNQASPAVDYRNLMASGVRSDDEWRAVTLTGSYDAASQLQVKYRSLNDSQGSEVVTVMTTTQGDHVLIDRGFIASGLAGADTESMPAPPSGRVTVTGYLRVNESGKDNATGPTQTKTIRLINSTKIGDWLSTDLLDGYVSLASSSPAQPGGLTPLGLPSLDEGPHLSYAIQWFSFAAIAVGGLVILVRGDIKKRRQAHASGTR